jgi:glycosyltransferase involved in cell wall biosynthesis
MRILFLSHYFPPEVNAPAHRTFEHCREWVRMGHEVHVVTCIPSHPAGRPFAGYRRRWNQREVMEGVIIHRVYTYLAPNKGTYRRALNYLSFVPTSVWRTLRLGRFDIIIATSPQFFCAVAGWLSAKLKRTPWVFELRDLWPESIAAVGAMKRSLALRAIEKLELHLYRSASGIACVTQSFVENLAARGIAREKCVYIPNGVAAEEWRGQGENDIRASHGVANGDLMVSYIGTVGMAHGIEVVLDAAEKLDHAMPVRFFIVGDGAQLSALKRQAQNRRLPNVTFTGLVPHDAAKQYLAASDVILVHLRKSELFKTVLPSKMFEAMGGGKPIILGVEGEALAVLERSGAGLAIPPGDAFALAEAIGTLSKDPSRREQMGVAGRSFVEKEFSREVWAIRYEAWLRGQVRGETMAG